MIYRAQRRLAGALTFGLGSRLPRRGSERGFTLIELLIVLVIVAILLSIAITTNIAMRRKASATAAQSLLYQVVPALEAYNVDRGSYAGVTLPALQAYNQALDATKYRFGTVTEDTYCVQVTYHGEIWRKNGPGERPVELPCP